MKIRCSVARVRFQRENATRSSVKARKLGPVERAHRTFVRDVGEFRTSETSSDATVDTWNRREPLGVLCVMRVIGISTTSHAKSAKKDRLTVASHPVCEAARRSRLSSR